MADQPTPQQIEALATPDDDSVSAAPTSADLLGVSAFYGNPKIQGSKGRQASSDSNQQAAMLGPSLARGAVAGLGGIPGDAESLVRLFLNNYVDENGNKQGLGLDDKTVLPTTGDLNDYLPGKTAGGMNALATGVGNLIGPGMAGDVVKGGSALAKYLAPAVGDALDAAHTAAGGKAFAWSDAPDMKSNFTSWPGIQKGALLGREYSNTGAAIPLNRHLDDLGEGMGFLRPQLDDMLSRQQATGLEHGSEISLDHAPSASIPIKAGNENSVEMPVLENQNGGSLINIHTHPDDSLALPSNAVESAGARSGDIGHFNWRTGKVAPNESFTGLILNQRKPGTLDYSSRTIPGQSDLLDPMYYNPVMRNMKIAIDQGAFDPAIRDAMDQSRIISGKQDEARATGRDILGAAVGHLPHAYFDTKGMSRSAHDFTSTPYISAIMRNAWPVARDVVGNLPGYASGGSVQAPTVSGPQTVGLAQFAGANDASRGATGASTGGQSGDPTGFLSGAGSSIGSSTPTTSSSSTPYYGDSNSFWNNVGGGSLPQPISDSTAPTFNANTQFGHDFLSDTINSMGHKGGILQGMDALVGAYEPYTPASGEGATEAGPQAGSGTWNTQQLINGAKQFGIDLSNYDLNPADQQLGMRAGIGAGVPMVPGVAHPANGEGGIADAANSFNNQTANYRTLAGASAGWDGSGNARSGSRELYQVQPDGTWLPVNQPVPFAIPKTGDWAHQNADLVSAISVMLPAVGGWAGLLGQTGATAGLTGGALTAANAGINALGTAALGGNPITGLAGAAGGYLGGLAGVSPTLGSMAGSQLAKYFTTPSANSPSAAQAIPVPAPVVNTPQTLPNIGSYFTTPAKQPT